MQQTHGPTTSELRAHNALASILDAAVADRHIHTNPARGVKPPRNTDLPVHVTRIGCGSPITAHGMIATSSFIDTTLDEGNLR